MHEFDLTFLSANSAAYPKRTVAWVVAPDQITPRTGLLHCGHGWGGNRFQYNDLMREFAVRYDLVCVATEYRQSGYDFDPVTGRGASLPYDCSFYQVVDCLNAVRAVLRLFPSLDRRRLLAFGGSQGGHITVLMTVIAPETFACAISGSGLAFIDAERARDKAGRTFSADERAVRNLINLAPLVRCPVVLMHGTADDHVPDSHSRALAEALRQAGRVEVRSRYYDGAGHGLEPVTDRRAAAIELADDLLQQARRPDTADDFAAARRIEIPAATRTLVLDWSKESQDHELISWRDGIAR